MALFNIRLRVNPKEQLARQVEICEREQSDILGMRTKTRLKSCKTVLLGIPVQTQNCASEVCLFIGKSKRCKFRLTQYFRPSISQYFLRLVLGLGDGSNLSS